MAEVLVELYKEFLPGGIGNNGEFGVVDFTMSVSRSADVKEGGEEVKTYHWEGFFNFRLPAASRISLHNIDGDDELLELEKKLLLLKEGITTFSKEIREKIRGVKKERIYKREWLNPAEFGSDYTGYYFYNICPDGGARFVIADCHKSVILYFDFYPDMRNIDYLYLKKKLKQLRALGKAISTFNNKLIKLRKRCQNNEFDFPVNRKVKRNKKANSIPTQAKEIVNESE